MNQNYNFVRGLFSQETNARNEELATKTGTSFKSLLLLVVFALFAGISMQGQSTANYAFTTNATGSLALDANSNAIDMTTGTTQLVAAGVDTGASTVNGIGFNFYGMGTFFNNFSANSNGAMALGNTAVSSSGTTNGGSATALFISPFGGDAQVGATGKVHYKIVGTAPNRTLVVEWYNMELNWSSNSADGTFQVRLYETTGVIEYVFGPMNVVSVYSSGPYIGFSSGSAAGTIASITSSTNTVTTNGTSYVANTYAVGTIDLNSVADGSRRVYKFTPTIPASGPTALVCSGVTSSTTTLSWTAASPTTNIVRYIVFNSTDGGTTYNYVANVALGTNTYAATGLTPGTTYTWKVVAVSEGVESTSTTATQATVAGATYYWVGTTGGFLSTPVNWNTMADGTGTTRATSATTDILIVDGDVFATGGATTISVDVAASYSIGQLKVTSNTALTLQSNTTATKTITITSGPGDDFVVANGSSLTLNHAANAVAFTFSGTGNTGNIAGTVNLAGSASNLITTTGGTGTLVSVASTGIVNLGASSSGGGVNSLVGSAATLSFLAGSNCNSTGATTGAPAVPLATWDTTSTLTITGLTTSITTATNNNQSFGNIVFNCPLLTTTLNWFGSTTTGIIKGNLTITAAGETGGAGIFRATSGSGLVKINGNVTISQGRFQATSTSTGSVIANGDTTIAANGILELSTTGTGGYSQRGATLTNNGVLTGTSGTLSFVNLTGSFPQTLAGTGTVLTNVGVLTLQNSGGLTISHTNQIPTLRVNLFQGGIIGSGKITIGTGLAVATAIQVGANTATILGGNFDVAPTWSLGTGTLAIIYSLESASRTTGFEIPTTRVVSSISNYNTGLILNGPIATGTLTFQAGSGNITTTTANLLTVTGTATTSIVRTSTTAYVNGPLALTLPVSLLTGSNYTFPIGKGTLNPFVLVSPMTGATAGATVTVQAEVFDAATGGTPGSLMGALNPNRYWAASITAGATNFTDTLIQLSDTTTGLDAIATSTTLTGAYDLVGGVSTTTLATSLTSTAPKATTLPGFFVMGNKAAATLTNLAITPTGNACTNAVRTVTVTATPGGGAVTGVVINYSINGAAQTAIAMTSTTGNNWSGVIPTVTPANATVAWSVTATDANALVKTAIGTPYSDEPTLGVTATATASLATVCAGSPTNLTMLLSRPAATLGTGVLLTSATTQPTAFCNRWGGYRSQTVYTAAELIASGLSAGSITSMAYNITTLGDSATNADFTVKIGTTALSALTTTFVATTSFTTVYPSQTYTHTASGQQVINFSTPYIWDGTSNIIIEVMHSGADAANNAITYYTTTTGNTVLTATSTTASTGTQSTQRLNLILQFNPIASAYSWSDGTTVVGTTNPLTVNPTATTSYTGTATVGGCPIVAAPVTVTTLPLPSTPTAVSTTQCGSIVPLAAVTATSGAAGTGEFKWYAALTGGVALQSSASTTYLAVVSTTTTFYVSEVGANACESARVPVTITVLTPPVLTLSTTPSAICAGAATTAVTITSTLSDYTNYTWSPSTGVTDTGSGFTFSPTATTTYVLAGSNSVTGCATTANVVVTVNPLPLITSATSSSEPLCIGSSTTLTAVSIPSAVGNATVGTGTTLTFSNSYPTAFDNYYYQVWQQYLFKASELNALGLVAGNINSITFKIAAAPNPNTPLADYNVRIGSTPDNILTGFTTTGLINVFGPASVTAAVGFNTITFTTPYSWDGFSNIVIDLRQTGAYGSANATTYYTATSYNSVLYATSSSNNPSFWTSGPTVSTSTQRPNIIFGGQVGTNLTSTADWTWSPATALSATTGNVVVANPTVSTVYTVTAVNPLTTCTASRTVSVTVLPLPAVPTATNATQCGTQLSTASVSSNLASPIFVWYAGPTGGVALQTDASTTYLTEISATTTLYVSVSDGSCESSPRVPIVMTVTTPPTIAITKTVPSFCGTGGATTLTATSADTGMTYSWASLTPSAILDAVTTNASVAATVTETSSFEVTGTATDLSCLPIKAYVSIGVYELPSATVTTDANGVCPGTTANIDSGLTAGNFAVTSIPYAATTAPLSSSSLMKNGVAITPLTGGNLDDGGWSGIPIGFNFNYFGTNFSTISASTNGVLMFGTPPGYGTGSGQLGQYSFTGPPYFPNTANPANIIALMAAEMDMSVNTVDGSIKYWTEGYAPNRVFVIQYKKVKIYTWSASDNEATVQCRLSETIGLVEIHVFSKTITNNAIIGLQDATRTIGAVAPSRAGGAWTVTTPEAWRFTPPANYNTIWTATTVNGSSTLASGTNIFTQTVAPLITTTYSISYTNQTTGCANVAGSAQTVMTVLGNTAPVGVNTIASSTSICTGQTVNFSLDYTGSMDGLVLQWQSFDGTSWADIALATTATYSTIPTTASQYRCRIVACNGTAGYSNPASIVLANAIATTTPATRCGIGTVALQATGNTGTTISWYDAITGGNLVGTGSPFTTPSISANATYYAGAESFAAGSLPVGLGGTLSSSTGASFFPGSYGGAKTQYIIKASELIAAGIGAGNITSLGFEPTNSGQTYQGFSVSMAPTASTVMTTTFETTGLSQVYLGTLADNGYTPVINTVNNLAFGTGVGSASAFTWDGISNILVSISWSRVPLATTATSTTMKVDDVGFVCSAYNRADSLTPEEMLATPIADGTGTSRPRFTINGQVVCSSPRVAVTATVTTPPTIDLSGNPAPICSEQTTAAVTIVGSSVYDTYAWTPASSASGTPGAGWVFNPLVTTTYTLAVSQSTGTAPCATTKSITVTVNPTPSVITIATTPSSACVDTVLPLVATGGTLDNMPILNENFNGTTNTWTTVNNSTGGTPSAADWTLQPNGYSYGGFFSTIFNSNDNSQFYMSNSDAQGSSSITNTELKSPVFSTTGFSVANLSFYHYLRFPETGTVDYSINGGTTWVNIQTYTTTTQGTSTGFVNENLALPAGALNQASVMIRFNYIDSYGYYWAIDNVSISGTQVATMVWSPTTNLYSDAAGTIAYTGGNASTVYFKSSSVAPAVTYTATATSALLCARTATVPVTVNANTTLALTSANATQTQTVCAGTAIANIVYTVTNGTGVTATYPAGLTGALVGGIYTISGTPTASGAISVTGTGLCLSSAALSGTITVNPDTTIALASANATQTVCTGTAIANIVYTVTNGTAVTATYPAGLTGTLVGGTYTISGTPTASGAISVTGTGLCLASAALTGDIIVSVTAAPTGAATQSLSSLLTVGDIVVVGSNIVWYASSADATAGINPIPASQILANTIYYATQTVAGCTSTSSLAVTIVTLANQDFDMTQFSYYPNPVIDLLNISYSQDMTNVKVFNVIGQQLFSKEVNAASTQIDMSAYANGAYFIQVSTENAMKTVRVIKK